MLGGATFLFQAASGPAGQPVASQAPRQSSSHRRAYRLSRSRAPAHLLVLQAPALNPAAEQPASVDAAASTGQPTWEPSRSRLAARAAQALRQPALNPAAAQPASAAAGHA